MADFLPNLDDAELHLPSDIYPRQSPTIFSSSRATETPEFPSELTYMQDLAEQLAELALNDRILSQQAPKPPPNAPQFRLVPPLQNGFGRGGYFAASVRDPAGFGNGGFRPGSRPVYPVYPVYPIKPYPAQVETFVRGRGRALRTQQPDPVRDRVVPPRRFSNGSARGCRGTGVFLPRVTAVSPETKKKPTMKKAEQAQPIRNAGKQGMSFQRPPPEMGLPQDSSY